MPQDEDANERTRLLLVDARAAELSGRRRSSQQRPTELDEAPSIISSHVSKEEQELAGTAVGERLPYNNYTTIDWLHDLVCPIGICKALPRLTTASDQGLISISGYPFSEKHQRLAARRLGSMPRMGSSRPNRAVHRHCGLSGRRCGRNNIRLQGRVLCF
jgi:hypothetical protein